MKTFSTTKYICGAGMKTLYITCMHVITFNRTLKDGLGKGSQFPRFLLVFFAVTPKLKHVEDSREHDTVPLCLD